MVGIENFVGALENFGKFTIDFFKDEHSMYIATFVLFFFMLYGILLAIIGKVPSMSDDGKVNRYGKAVSIAIAAISTASIYKVGGVVTAKDIVTKVLVPYGVFAGAILAFVFFAIIYFGMGNKEEGKWNLAVVYAGLATAIAGYFASKPMVQALGWIIGFIGLILYTSSAGLLKEEKKK